jgi:enoyl-CoA hydratase
MPSVGDALQRLIDVRDIEQLLFEYCRCADSNDPDGLARCFTEDCIARYGPGPVSIGANARREQASRDLRMFSATSHHLSNVHVEHVDGDRARVESVVFAWHRPLDTPGVWELFGRYVDVVVRTRDGWKIAERTLQRVATDGFPTEWEWLDFMRSDGPADEPGDPTPNRSGAVGQRRRSEDPSVTVRRDGWVLTITIDRYEVRNAYDRDVAEQVSAALDQLDAEDDLRVGVLHGAGGVFSSGMDLRRFLDGELPATTEHGLLGLVERSRTKPLIAAVDGYAIAAGFEVALACDFIVASRDAYFALTEVKRGLVPAGGALRNLPRRIPLAVAAELALTGRSLGAERAYELGLVVRLADPGGSRGVALELAAEIAANAPGAVRAIRAVIAAQPDWTEAEFWTGQAAIVASNQSGPDAVEGATAFLERRAPRWNADSDRH